MTDRDARLEKARRRMMDELEDEAPPERRDDEDRGDRDTDVEEGEDDGR